LIALGVKQWVKRTDGRLRAWCCWGEWPERKGRSQIRKSNRRRRSRGRLSLDRSNRASVKFNLAKFNLAKFNRAECNQVKFSLDKPAPSPAKAAVSDR
jgi:hypothetical protein